MSPRSRPGPWAVVGVSIAAVGATQFGLVAIGALAPEIQHEFGLSRTEIGLLPSLVFLGCMVTSIPAGRLTDARGAASVLGVALVAFAVAVVLAAAAPTATLLMAAVFAAGLGYGGIQPPTNAVVAGRLARRRGLFLSIKQTGVPLGGLLAGVTVPSVAVAFGWRWALALTVLGVLAAALASPLLRAAAVVEEGEIVGGRESPLSRNELLAVGFFGFVMSGSQWTLLSYLSLYLTDGIGLTLAAAGAALALSQGVGAAGRLGWGWLSDAPGRRLTVLLAIAATSLVALLALASGVGGPFVWVAAAAAGLSLIGWNGAYNALLADLAGAGRVGRASGDALVFLFAGVVVLPPFFGFVSDATAAWWTLWLANAGAVAVAGGALWAVVGLAAPRVAAPARGS